MNRGNPDPNKQKKTSKMKKVLNYPEFTKFKKENKLQEKEIITEPFDPFVKTL